ncbi:acyl-CoA dehydrogenase [Talaromyces stipitatus ATCC 10500]|uniref:Acyl-CoA dehydrogenase n=1 Tax=Talaromyces stipitatus (strain ATCC 10500 / CBS 375.48 / QM 6759 / NRRL 1006) TaxID=441959 RepID=B8MR03_TALSN|nr:acyl-CoA dehydrogenase [Talaromyces stipitatus ATCC 10500]EED12838.1 acyl-CoA dehydrogenase [Talaromyces stipitatus ATCC 10500]
MAPISRPVIAPYSEPLLPQLDIKNPHYTETHHHLRRYVRDYVETNIIPYAQEWEEAGEVPEEVRLRHCHLGFSIVHPLTSLEDADNIPLPGGVPREKWDTWCSLIVADELTRCGFVGVVWGLGGGNSIGAPSIARFGTPEQRKRWLPGVASGKTRFCLGITEPDAGSDVANISTTAKTEGDYYIVNGAKKWITNGLWADYCTAAVRTGGPGRKGVSVLVIPLKQKGVTRKRMHNSGVNASGSTFLEFDDVRVPADHLIGRVNEGFQIVMSNFNSERLSLACAALRLARVCVEDAFNYAVQRETFGAPLITRQAIQFKITKCGMLIEPAQSFLEQLVYIIETTKDRPNAGNIGGMTALLKVMSTRALEKCVREAQQIFGGAGYNKGGKGVRVEQISRDVRVHVVGGGSEEIMMGLALQEEIKALKSRQKASQEKTAKL